MEGLRGGVTEPEPGEEHTAYGRENGAARLTRGGGGTRCVNPATPGILRGSGTDCRRRFGYDDDTPNGGPNLAILLVVWSADARVARHHDTFRQSATAGRYPAHREQSYLLRAVPYLRGHGTCTVEGCESCLPSAYQNTNICTCFATLPTGSYRRLSTPEPVHQFEFLSALVLLPFAMFAPLTFHHPQAFVQGSPIVPHLCYPAGAVQGFGVLDSVVVVSRQGRFDWLLARAPPKFGSVAKHVHLRRT